MKVISRAEIVAAFDFVTAAKAIKSAFIAFSAGKVNSPPVGYLGFTDPPGDMHLKYGHIEGDNVFVVKMATGFYDNPKQGLPSSNGLMIVISAKTGQPLALLQDEGFLTDIRTAIAGALATQALAPAGPKHVAILGTGIQARLQLECLLKLTKVASIHVWGRNQQAAESYQRHMLDLGIDVTTVASAEMACSKSNIIITTTPAASPILKTDWVQENTHITAVGADAPGKQELTESLFDKAALTVCDSREQCLHHGEMSHAKKDVFTSENSIELGELFAKKTPYTRPTQAITIADLTGIAAQDIAIAKSVWEKLA